MISGQFNFVENFDVLYPGAEMLWLAAGYLWQLLTRTKLQLQGLYGNYLHGPNYSLVSPRVPVVARYLTLEEANAP